MMAAAVLTPPHSPPPTAPVPTHLHPVAVRTTASNPNSTVAAKCLLAQQAIRLRPGEAAAGHSHDDGDDDDDGGSSDDISSSSGSDGEGDAASALSHASVSSFACSSTPFNVDDLASSTSEASLASLLGTGTVPNPANFPLTPSPSHPASPVAHDYLGLRVDAAVYPVHPSTADTATPVRLISAAQYADLVARARQHHPADQTERALFPFLHGADVVGSNQAAYFGFGGRTRCPIPNYRGLITVTADTERRCPLHTPHRIGSSSTGGHSSSSSSIAASISSASLPLSASTSSTSIFTDFSSGSMSSSISSACSCVGVGKLDSLPQQAAERQRRGRGPEARSHLLCSTLVPEDILAQPSLLPSTPHGTSRFLEPPLPAQVNLRNFRLQPAKYATISDIVVYSAHGATPAAVELARRCKEAQESMAKRRRSTKGVKEQTVEYNVYVVEDTFDVFERDHEELVSVDGMGWRWNRTDFFEREREEMRVLTEASKIANNVWLGNTQDVPTPARTRTGSTDSSVSSGGCSDSMCDSPTSSTDSDDDDLESNTRSFAIAIEAHDAASMPTRSNLEGHSKFLNEVESECRTWCAQADELLKDAGESPTPITLTRTAYTACTRLAEGVLHPHVNDVVHMDCVSTAQACDGGCGPNSNGAKQFLEGLVGLVQFVHEQANPAPGSTRLARRVLIHCSDGYTESSVLALAYVMWDRECSLPEAYLWLQDGCAAIDERGRGRSFFVYADDVQFLMRLEERFRSIRDQKRKAERRSSGRCPLSPTGMGASLKCSPAAGLGLSLLRRSTSTSSATSANATPTPGTPLASPQLGAPTSPPPVALPPVPKSPSGATANGDKTDPNAWFHSKHFDGHFPSRILPYLYLGNLNHAMNADMLAVLGITHVISVGETALVPPRPAIMGRCAQVVLGRGRSGNGGSNAGASGVPQPGGNELKDMKEGNALYRAQRDGRVKVLDVKGILDDGIDPIKESLEDSIKFVDEARESGGRCLVHCRVGVSRSATMVIGYLMSRLGWSLEKAYLVTRSRRLNILIQPNLRLFYELHLFDLDLYAQRRQARQAHLASSQSTTDDRQSRFDQLASSSTSASLRPGFSRAASIAPSDMSVDDDTTAVQTPAVRPEDDMAIDDAVESLVVPSSLFLSADEKTPQPKQKVDEEWNLDETLRQLGLMSAGGEVGRKEGDVVELRDQKTSVPLDWPFLAREIGQLNMRYLC